MKKIIILVFAFCIFWMIGYNSVSADAYRVDFQSNTGSEAKVYTLENDYTATKKVKCNSYRGVNLDNYICKTSKWRVGAIEHRYCVSIC